MKRAARAMAGTADPVELPLNKPGRDALAPSSAGSSLPLPLHVFICSQILVLAPVHLASCAA